MWRDISPGWLLNWSFLSSRQVALITAISHQPNACVVFAVQWLHDRPLGGTVFQLFQLIVNTNRDLINQITDYIYSFCSNSRSDGLILRDISKSRTLPNVTAKFKWLSRAMDATSGGATTHNSCFKFKWLIKEMFLKYHLLVHNSISILTHNNNYNEHYYSFRVAWLLILN